MFPVFLSLGSNLGDRRSYLETAVRYIDRIDTTRVTRVSSLWKTEPWGKREQPLFLNQVTELQTEMDPTAFLTECQAVENRLGRVKRPRWREREIDIDIVLWGPDIIRTNNLLVPHPRLSQRRFVLAPLAELAADRVVPGTGKRVEELLHECVDQCETRKL